MARDPKPSDTPRIGIRAEHALRDALLAWAGVAVLVTALVRINITLPAVGHLGSALVAVLFLYVPVFFAWKRTEELDDYAFHAEPIRRGLIYAVAGMLLIYPIFTMLYFAFYEIVCNSAALSNLAVRGMCGRYGGLSEIHAPELTWKLAEFCAVQLVVVALPEELFFRGFLLGLLEKRFPPKRRFLGGGIGKALVLSALAFSLIHLPKDGDPRALMTFFPGLFFGWLRSSTGSILGPTIAHASANILIRFLDLATMR